MSDPHLITQYAYSEIVTPTEVSLLEYTVPLWTIKCIKFFRVDE